MQVDIKTVTVGNILIDQAGANIRTHYTTFFSQFIQNRFGRIDGDSKPDAFDTGNSDLRRIDTYDLPFRIDQRTAGIAGIDRRISLDQVKFTFP